MKQLILGGIVTVLSLTSVIVNAKTDSDGDGYFSRDELVTATYARYEKKFTKADVNQDAKVTLDEIAGKKLTVAKSADQNKDGVITLPEVRKYVETSIDKKMLAKDLDKDGKLSKEERQRKSVKNDATK